MAPNARREWTEYDIGPGDRGTVDVSTDGGVTWTSISGDITGSSGGWVQQSFNLAAYQGTTIDLRFLYETDGSTFGTGWIVDDIFLPTIEFLDDIEGGPDGWSAQGWGVVSLVRPVPESATLAIFAAGLAGLAFMRGRKVTA